MKNQFRVKPIKLSSFKKFLIEGYDDDDDDDDDDGDSGFQNEYEDLYKKGYITKINGKWQEGYYFNDFLDWWSKTSQSLPMTEIYKKLTEFLPADNKPSQHEVRKIIQNYANKATTQFGGGVSEHSGFYGIQLPDNVSQLNDDELLEALKLLNPKESEKYLLSIIAKIQEGEKKYGSRKIYDNTQSAQLAAREQAKVFSGSDTTDIRQGRVRNPTYAAKNKMNIVDTWFLKSFKPESPEERSKREHLEHAPRPLDEIYADLNSEGVFIENFEDMSPEQIEETLNNRIDPNMTNKARALYAELENALQTRQLIANTIKKRGAEGKPEKYLMKMDFAHYSLALSRRLWSSEKFVESNGYDPAFIPFYATDDEIQSIKDAINPPGKKAYKELKHADVEELNERARRRQAALKIITVIRGRGPTEEEEESLYSNERVSPDQKRLADYFTHMNRALTLAEKEKNKQYQARIREDRDHPDWNDSFDNNDNFELGKSRWPSAKNAQQEADREGREQTYMGLRKGGNIRLTSIGPNTNFASLPLNAMGLNQILGGRAGYTFAKDVVTDEKKGKVRTEDSPSLSHNEFFGDAYLSKFDKIGVLSSNEDDDLNKAEKKNSYWRFLLDPLSLAYHFDPRTWWYNRVLMPLTNQQKQQIETELDKKNIKSIHDLNGGYGRLPDLKDPYFLYAWNDFMRKQKMFDKLSKESEEYTKNAKETMAKAYPKGFDENDEYLRYPLTPSDKSLADEVKELYTKYVSGTFLPDYITKPSAEQLEIMKKNPDYDPAEFFGKKHPKYMDPENKKHRWSSPSERERSFRSEIFKNAISRIEEEKRRQGVFNTTIMSTIEDGNSIFVDDIPPQYDEDGNEIPGTGEKARFSPHEQEQIRKALESGRTRSHTKLSQQQQRIMNTAQKRNQEAQENRSLGWTTSLSSQLEHQKEMNKLGKNLEDEDEDNLTNAHWNKIASPERFEDEYGDIAPNRITGEAGRIDTFGSNFYDWELYPFGDPDIPRPRDLTDPIDYNDAYDEWGNYQRKGPRDPYADIAQYGFSGEAYDKISGANKRHTGAAFRRNPERHYDKSGKLMNTATGTIKKSGENKK